MKGIGAKMQTNGVRTAGPQLSQRLHMLLLTPVGKLRSSRGRRTDVVLLGPRICLGKQMGLTLIAYTVVRIVQQYDRIESCDVEDSPKIATGLVGFKHGGVRLKMIPNRF